MKLKVTTVLFNNTITPEEVYYLRGVVFRLADYATIFHNHVRDKYQCVAARLYRFGTWCQFRTWHDS